MTCTLAKGLGLAGAFAAVFGVEAALAQAAPAPEPLPAVLWPASPVVPLAPAAGSPDSARVLVSEFAQPGTVTLRSSGAFWAPGEAFTLRTGLLATSVEPCPAALRDDCAWLRVDTPQAGATSYTVGASWKPLSSLELSVDYASGPTLVTAGQATDEAVGTLLRKEDLNLSCRLDASSWGDLEVGLRLSRWRDDATLGEEPERSAALGVAWELGAFRGGLTSRYMEMLGGTDSAWNTFDVNFAWRTPWNARLSVGATNLLDAAAPAEQPGLDDARVEDFLGRVPYVRYQQDL